MWWQARINQEIRDDIPSQRAISDTQKKRSRPVCIITGHKHCAVYIHCCGGGCVYKVE